MIIVGEVRSSNTINEITDRTLRSVEDAVRSNTLLLAQRAQGNVDGPRPSKLGQRTGNLFRSIGSSAVVTQNGFVFSGSVGTDVRADNGFAYGAYWEGKFGTGTHTPWPRQFLKPALDSIRDKFFKDVEKAVKQST